MEITARIDWMRVSVPAETRTAHTLLAELDCNTTTDECRPFPWYTHSRRINGGGRVDWNEDAPRQGVLYTFTGSDLTAQALRGIYPTTLAARFRAITKANFTRLDLALDVYDSAANPNDLMENFRQGTVPTHVQKATSVMGYNKAGEPHGQTQYFGSRTGERMLRAYDKGAEQGCPEAWTRLELELKQAQANRAASALKTASVGVVASGMMQEFLPFQVTWYQQVMAACQAGNFDEKYIGRHEGDHKTWVEKTAGPAFLHALAAGEAAPWNMLVEFMRQEEGHYYATLQKRMLSAGLTESQT